MRSAGWLACVLGWAGLGWPFREQLRGGVCVDISKQFLATLPSTEPDSVCLLVCYSRSSPPIHHLQRATRVTFLSHHHPAFATLELSCSNEQVLLFNPEQSTHHLLAR